jgi:hypothetical protein
MIEVKAWQGSESKECSRLKHIPMIIGKCKIVNPKTPSGFLLWDLGVLRCPQDLGQGLGIKPCTNWIFFKPLEKHYKCITLKLG